MKRVVLSSGLREADIRPPALMSEFRRLSIRDAEQYLGGGAALEPVACPACGVDEPAPAFERQGFTYQRCGRCASLYVSPRPPAEALARYYAESEASKFRVEHFSRDTAKARRHHLLCSHADWMGQLSDEAGPEGGGAYADIESYSPEIFEEVARLAEFSALYAVDPLLPPDPALKVNCCADWRLPAPLAAVSAFEKIEHQHDPLRLLLRMKDLLAPGGLLFLTTRTSSGFDLQVLGEHAAYIFVPEHLNLLSVEGLETLTRRAGLELIELSTPGQLDLQLVQAARAADPALPLPPFIDYLLNHRDALAHEDFQAFLQKHRLSSHVRLAARKPRKDE
ncbi:MAG: hypothetical protein RLZZ303_1632 [Candidatus Hydrogenedentota bacterium]